MNWSIIEGKSLFITNLFKYDEGIDSGEIGDSQHFEINLWDDIASLQHKNTISQVKLLIKNLPKIVNNKIKYIPQRNDIQPTYYPKRVPEDGVINWRDNTRNIFSLVKAVANPYPGAFTFHNKQKIFIWEDSPFDAHIRFDKEELGKIVFSFFDKSFIVKTLDSSFYVKKWESSFSLGTKDWHDTRKSQKFQLGKIKKYERKGYRWKILKDLVLLTAIIMNF